MRVHTNNSALSPIIHLHLKSNYDPEREAILLLLEGLWYASPEPARGSREPHPTKTYTTNCSPSCHIHKYNGRPQISII